MDTIRADCGATSVWGRLAVPPCAAASAFGPMTPLVPLRVMPLQCGRGSGPDCFPRGAPPMGAISECDIVYRYEAIDSRGRVSAHPASRREGADSRGMDERRARQTRLRNLAGHALSDAAPTGSWRPAGVREVPRRWSGASPLLRDASWCDRPRGGPARHSRAGRGSPLLEH